MDRLMDEGPAGRAAGLSAPCEVHSRDHRLGNLARIGIRESDQSVLAAKFQKHRLDSVCRTAHHGTAGGNATDERNFRD